MVRSEVGSERGRIVNLDELAYRTGSEPELLRRAGTALFTSLASDDPDLSEALIAASNASGVEPRQMVAMLNVLAFEFEGQRTELSRTETNPQNFERVSRRVARGTIAARFSRLVGGQDASQKGGK